MPIDASNDLPPGAPAYAAGPLANQRPTAGQFLASGQSQSKFLAPTPAPTSPPTGLAGGAQGGAFTRIAKDFLSKASSSLASMFGSGGNPTTNTSQGVVASGGNLADRTTNLEGGLNALEQRSTGFRTSPNVVVAPASGVTSFNKDFAARQGPTPAEYNSLTPVQRAAYDQYKNQSAEKQQDTPNFYQQLVAGSK